MPGDGGGTSSRAHVVAGDVFSLVARLEVEKSFRLHYPVSLVTFHLQAAAPVRLPPSVAVELGQLVAALTRGTDLIRLADAGDALHLLLVDAPFEHLPSVVQRVRDELQHYRFRVNGDLVSVAVTVEAACVPTTAAGLDELCRQAAAPAS